MLRHILIFILAFVAIPLKAQQNPDLCSDKPRLVLIILIDNFNNEQLEIIRSRCGRDGFNRICNFGSQLQSAYYDAGGNYAGKNLATLFTGAPAATHGIVAEQWIDNFSGKKVHAVYGDAYDGKGMLDTLAIPKNGSLLCSTIGNEIRKIYNDKAHFISLGFDPNLLMWSSGTNVPEPIIWFDKKKGEFVSQNVKGDTIPGILREFNSKKMADMYLGKFWAPKYDISEYHEWKYFNKGTAQRTFYYPLKQTGSKEKYARVAGSPYGNQMVRDMAASILLCGDYGKDDVPDVMTLQFTATPSCGHKIQPLDAETEDLLVQLDENIASLLKVIDHDIGMDNTLVVLTSAQGCYDVANTDTEHWKSWGTVSLNRTTALLNLYLMALHGQEKWVKNYASGEIYLNRDLCEKKHVSFDTLLIQSAEFMKQVTGIGDAIVAKHLTSIYSDSPVIAAMRKNYNSRRSGDILLSLEPGWAEEQDDGSELTQLWGQEYVPLVFYGWKVPRQTIYERHSMADVAPTVCSFIRVSLPNGCSGVQIPIVDFNKRK
ncbi:MAG: alkaline phosphatase family protein [Bacteroidales bacterium]|nr:alkaline phosphatase family protein [Bacteroidales bacterium]